LDLFFTKELPRAKGVPLAASQKMSPFFDTQAFGGGKPFRVMLFDACLHAATCLVLETPISRSTVCVERFHGRHLTFSQKAGNLKGDMVIISHDFCFFYPQNSCFQQLFHFPLLGTKFAL